MSEFRRRLMMQQKSRLPAGYRECEYLESHGTEYIQTGMKIYPLDIIRAKIETYNRGAFYSAAIIGGSAWSQSAFYINLSWESGGTIGNVSVYKGSAQLCKKVLGGAASYTFEIETNPTIGILVNNEAVYGAYDTNTLEPRLPYCCLFARGNETTAPPTQFGYGRIYNFEMWRESEEIIHLIPALDPNGVPCMFDMISQTPLYNQGTGTFGYKLK